MKTFQYTITDDVGIHARPAGAIVKEARKFTASITIECQGKTADAKKLMALMGLGAAKGMELTVVAEGEDEEAAISDFQTFLKEKL